MKSLFLIQITAIQICLGKVIKGVGIIYKWTQIDADGLFAYQLLWVFDAGGMINYRSRQFFYPAWELDIAD